MKPRSYFYCGLTTTLNIILYALTFGNFLWLEGRVRRGYFRNWLRRGYRPKQFEKPETEEEIVNLIKNAAGGIRTCGAGHSFNDGVATDHTLISLDRYTGAKREGDNVRVKDGMRERYVSNWVLAHGLAC